MNKLIILFLIISTPTLVWSTPQHPERLIYKRDTIWINSFFSGAKFVTSRCFICISDISEFELQIDQLVYQLYGLTEEEIAIIENSVK